MNNCRKIAGIAAVVEKKYYADLIRSGKMEDVKKDDSVDKAVKRFFLLLWVLVMTVGVAFFTWHAYLDAKEFWSYFIHLHPGIVWDLIKWAGWVAAMLVCCSLCLDSAIRSAMKYVRNLKIDFQTEVPESEETVVEEKATEEGKI